MCSAPRLKSESGLGAVLAAGEPGGVMKELPEAQSIVFVIDDDAAVREALKSLLRSVGMRVEVFGSAIEFLKYKLPDAATCLVLDIRMPGVSGLDFQVELTAKPTFALRSFSSPATAIFR
jgi:CheY-like chemotaxis protein